MKVFEWFRNKEPILIDSRKTLEEAAAGSGILPFFRNNVRGMSVEELCAPGLLFGGNYDEGCWEWKGPVIRTKTSAYGKFFRRKAGFVSLDLLHDFIRYRRAAYPVKPFSTEEFLLDIIRENGDITSTELKQYVFGMAPSKRNWDDLPEKAGLSQEPYLEKKRKSLEGPLQRLQMGGWILISDFEYKTTRKGERYGWGVARYSTPEYHFNCRFDLGKGTDPQKALDKIIRNVKKHWPQADKKSLRQLLK